MPSRGEASAWTERQRIVARWPSRRPSLRPPQSETSCRNAAPACRACGWSTGRCPAFGQAGLRVHTGGVGSRSCSWLCHGQSESSTALLSVTHDRRPASRDAPSHERERSDAKYLVAPCHAESPSSGADAMQQFYRWLDDMREEGIFGAWHSAGTKSDQLRTLALVEFEKHEDGQRALLAWPGPRSGY